MVLKMLLNSECPSQFVLSSQHSKSKKYSIYYHRGQRKEANPHIWEAGKREWLKDLIIITVNYYKYLNANYYMI